MVLHRLAKDHKGAFVATLVGGTGVDLGPPVGCVGYCPLE